jgi:hypothetical protein
MANDPYLNPVGLQLIRTPAASRRVLEAAAAGNPPAVPPEAEFAIASAKSWVKAVVQDAYQPPVGTPFLAFPQENGLCDVVRALYQVGGTEIELAQARYLFSLKLTGFRDTPGAADEKRAQEAARRVLVKGDQFRFTRDGAFGTGSYGRQDVAAAGRVDPAWPHWADVLRWWCEGTAIGFLTLKAAGGPTKAVIAPTEGLNRRWFS